MKSICTIKSIADELGITHGTVSRALNSPHPEKYMSESTRLRIKDTAARIGYVPNVNARRLVNAKSYLIGLVLPSCDEEGQVERYLMDRSLTDAMSGISNVLRSNGYRILLIDCDKKFIEREEYRTLFMEKSIDGMIAWGAKSDESFWNKAKNLNIVMANSRPTSCCGVPFVGIDNFAAGCEIASRLLNSGRRKIAYLDCLKRLSIAEERFSGYKNALADFGIPFDDTLVFAGKALDDSLAALLDLWHSSKGRAFDAVQCVNDGIAFSCGFELKKIGVRIPEDVMLSGGDRIESRYRAMLSWQIPLLSFRPDNYEIGRIAAQWVLDGISAKTEKENNLLLPVEFVELEHST